MSSSHNDDVPVAKKSTIDLARFRDMVGKQTEELNFAIRQRSEYENRLIKAEKDVTELRQANQMLQEALDAVVQRATVAPPATSLESPSPPPAETVDAVHREEVASLLSCESSARQDIVNLYWDAIVNDMMMDHFTPLQAELEKERAMKQERTHTAALTFQLRVATPIRLRNAIDKANRLEKMNFAAQVEMDGLHRQIDNLLFDSSDLRDQKGTLELKIEEATHRIKQLEDQLVAQEAHLEAEKSRSAADFEQSAAKKLEHLHVENEELRQMAEASQCEIEMLHQVNTELRQHLTRVEEALASEITERENNAKTLSLEAQEEIEKAHTQLVQITESYRALETEHRVVMTRQHALMAELESQQAVVTSLTLEKARLTTDLDESTALLERQMNEGNERASEQCLQLQAEVRALRTALGAADIEVSSMKYHNDVLQQQLQDAVAQRTQSTTDFLDDKKRMEEFQREILNQCSVSLASAQAFLEQQSVSRGELWNAKLSMFMDDAVAQSNQFMLQKKELNDRIAFLEALNAQAAKDKSAALEEAENRFSHRTTMLQTMMEQDKDTLLEQRATISNLEAKIKQLQFDVSESEEKAQQASFVATAALDDAKQRLALVLEQLHNEEAKVHANALVIHEKERDISTLQYRMQILEERVADLTAEEQRWIEREKAEMAAVRRARNAELDREDVYAKELQDVVEKELTVRRINGQLQTECHRLAEELRQAKDAEALRSEQCDALQSALSEKTAAVAILNQECETLAHAKREVERTLMLHIASMEDLKQVVNTSGEVIEAAQSAKANLTDEHLKLRDQCGSLTKELHAVKQELSRTSCSLSQTSEDLYQTTASLETAKKRITQLERTCQDQLESLEHCAEENESLRGLMEESIVAVETEMRALQIEVNSAKHDRDESLAMHNMKQLEVVRLQEAIASIQREALAADATWTERYRVMEHQCHTLREQLVSADQCVQQLSDAQRALQDGTAVLHEHANEKEREQFKTLLELQALIAQKDHDVVSLTVRVSELESALASKSEEVKQIESASLELLAEKECETQRLTELRRDAHYKLEATAETIARQTYELEKTMAELDEVRTQLRTLTMVKTDLEAQYSQERQRLIEAHGQEMLEKESMMEALLSQEHEANATLTKELASLRSARKQQELLLAEATENLAALELERNALRKQLTDVADKFAVIEEGWNTTRCRLQEQCRDLQMQLSESKHREERLRDTLELEKTSSVAEVEHWNEERRRREESCSKQLRQLADEHQLEIARRELVAQELQRSHASDVALIRRNMEDVQKQLQNSQEMQNGLLKKLAIAEVKVDEVAHRYGALLVEHERMQQLLRMKEEDLAAAIAQASTAADEANRAAERRAAAEDQSMELRKALIATQKTLEVAQRGEETLSCSIDSLEATIERRWVTKLDNERTQWQEVFAQLLSSTRILVERLEVQQRDALYQLYDQLSLSENLGMCFTTVEKWSNAHSKTEVEYQELLKLNAESHRQELQAQTAAASIQNHHLFEVEVRLAVVAEMYLGERQLLMDKIQYLSSHGTRLGNVLRTAQGRILVQDETIKGLRKNLEESESRCSALTAELLEEKQNKECFAKASEDASATAAEWTIKHSNMQQQWLDGQEVSQRVLQSAIRTVMESEVQERRLMQYFAYELHSDIGELLFDVLQEATQDKAAILRAHEKAERSARAALESSNETWKHRWEDECTQREDATLQCNIMSILSSEAIQRSAIVEASHQWKLIDFWPAVMRHRTDTIVSASQEHTAALRHGLFVTQKESQLVKQRASNIMEMEVASCQRVLDRLFRRRIDDLQWVPSSSALFPDQKTTSLTLKNKYHPEAHMALQSVEDLESKSRMTLTWMAADSLHALHMCLLNS